jgi:hypothetical protein
VLFIPLFIRYRAKAVPYYLAIIQHPLVADYFVGGHVQLFWPLTTQYYGIGTSIMSPENTAAELAAFLVAMILMLKTKDVKTLLQPHKSNLTLLIPTATVLLPTFARYPLDVPVLLVAPHLVYMFVFAVSIVIVIVHAARTRRASTAHTSKSDHMRPSKRFEHTFSKLTLMLQRCLCPQPFCLRIQTAVEEHSKVTIALDNADVFHRTFFDKSYL